MKHVDIIYRFLDKHKLPSGVYFSSSSPFSDHLL